MGRTPSTQVNSTGPAPATRTLSRAGPGKGKGRARLSTARDTVQGMISRLPARGVGRLLLAATAGIALTAAAAPGRAASPDAGGTDFQLRDSGGAAKEARGAKASRLQATKTDAVMKFFVIDKDKGPVKDVVISLTAPDGKKYYAEETDAEGYAEVLVPVGQKYEITYLALGRKDIAASVTVTNEPKQNVRLTLRYQRQAAPPPFILEGVVFDTAKATLRPESFPKLDLVVEFMAHKKKARVEISGHTDNVGKPKANKTLSEQRAQACRAYIVGKGIDSSRLEAVGFGAERPTTTNDTEQGRQRNRRIEAREL
jgi:outer membrane protein OmpA-like peptidoglycan-associated protein